MDDTTAHHSARGSDLDRCSGCGTTSERSLIVCIDGTSNQFSVQNTNVVELYSRLVKDQKQRTFYNSGIGTYAKPHGLTPKQWIMNKVDLAIAWKFDKTLLSAYRWLAETYEAGDRIFLFGFSRGAYQVRALSAMIEDVGLIHKGNQDQIPFAYKLYADLRSRKVSRTPLSISEALKLKLGRLTRQPSNSSVADGDNQTADNCVNMAHRFKKTFSRQDVKVHFIGVWDTVSSVGVFYDKTLPATKNGMTHVCVFRHALAIHERRVKFLPEFVGAAAANIRDNALPEVEPSGSSCLLPHVKEVWFAGSHSDIGGGNKPNMDLDQFGPSLRWMSLEGMLSGLRLGDDVRKWEDQDDGFTPHESMAFPWPIFELVPWPRLSFSNFEDRNEITYLPHVGSWRRALPDQHLHETAVQVLDPSMSYEKFLEGRAERDAGGEAYIDLKTHWRQLKLESDPYLDAQRTLSLLDRPGPLATSVLAKLAELVANEAGQQSIRDATGQRVIDAQKRRARFRKWGTLLLNALTRWLAASGEVEHIVMEALPLTCRLLEHIPIVLSSGDSDQLFSTAKSLAQRYPSSSAELLAVINSVEPTRFSPVGPILCAAFIPDDSRVVFGALLGGILWDFAPRSLEAGSGLDDSGIRLAPDFVVEALGVCYKDASISFPHFDNSFLLNPEARDVISVDGETGLTVRALAFSKDGACLLAGCENGTVFLCDVPPEGDKRSPSPPRQEVFISGLTWSKRRGHSVQGTQGSTFWAWNAETGVPAFNPSALEIDGGQRLVCIAQLASENRVNFVYCDQLGNVRRLKTTARPHDLNFSDPVQCVCFSPHGTHVALSSWRTVSVHPILPEAAIPITGIIRLSSNVLALAFGSDGRTVRAACQDGTVRSLHWTFDSLVLPDDS